MAEETNIADETLEIERRFRPSGWILRAETALRSAFDAFAVSRTDHSATMLDLVTRLRFAEDQTLRGVELGRQLAKTPGYVSRLIDQAEEAGLVSRNPDPEDRRAQRITLTTEGNSLFDATAPFMDEVLERTVYRALSPEEVENLISLLSRVAWEAENLLETGLNE